MRNRALPRLRLIAGFSPLCRKLDSRLVNVGFMADKVTLKGVFLLILRVYLGSISAPILDTNLFINQRRNTFLAKDSEVNYFTLKLCDRPSWLNL
jgi:hypothetical protein